MSSTVCYSVINEKFDLTEIYFLGYLCDIKCNYFVSYPAREKELENHLFKV